MKDNCCPALRIKEFFDEFFKLEFKGFCCAVNQWLYEWEVEKCVKLWRDEKGGFRCPYVARYLKVLRMEVEKRC